MPTEVRFSCLIDNRVLKEHYHAEVTVSKKQPIEVDSRGRINLAHIYITPVSGRLPQQRIKVDLATGAIEEIPGTRFAHDHFVLYSTEGTGFYIMRDRYDRDIAKVTCSIWDLGIAFASRVMDALRDIA